MGRSTVSASKRIVIKIGSALLTHDGQAIAHQRIEQWVGEIAALRQAGVEVILVSSGAVAAGMITLGWSSRPQELDYLQAAAAVGQSRLVHTYEKAFAEHQLTTAQVLLTNSDLSDRQRYLNARSTLRTCLKLGIIPIINENDTVVTDEIRFGDNDSLAALVANLVEADGLIILTDQSGLYTADPRSNPEAELISQGRANDPDLLAVAGGGGRLGRGGMYTKVKAASTAARSGAYTLIVGGAAAGVISRVCSGEALGTLLTPDQEPLEARKQWLAGHLQARGELHLDQGAEQALTQQGRSLLPVGVSAVSGEFRRGDLVTLIAPDQKLLGKGLVNYSAEECRQLCRVVSGQIQEVLGYIAEPEMVHRDNLVLLK